MHFVDTESIGFYGPTVLMQYCKDDGPPVIHNIWDNTVQSTLDLIERQLEDTVVGFNLAHDWFHYTRTYNVLSNLPKRYNPDPLDYLDVEKESLDKYCLRPKKACDLMLIGKKTKFQATMNQKSINMKKVPKVIAELLLKELKEKIPIPSIYFASSKKGYAWRMVPLIKGTNKEATNKEDEIDPNFVNIQLKFAPSTSLKSIMAYIGHEVVTLEDLDEKLPKAVEYSYFPTKGDWIDVFDAHLYSWRNDPRKITYAKNDPLYTRELWYYLDKPEGGDTDSELACAVGGMHWRGFSIDLEGCRKLLDEHLKRPRPPCNIHSPRQVKKWLHEVCSPLEQQVLCDTSIKTLEKISEEWAEDNPELVKRVNSIIDIRKTDAEVTYLKSFIKAGRMHCVNKIIGTKSNRMSGGSEKYIKTKGSVNPQGIPSNGVIRKICTLAPKDMILCGGDFSGFEVSIADAVYNDPFLRKELLLGKKMHGLFGAAMYNMTYEEIMATEHINASEPNGFYKRAKKGFFASLYGAEKEKLSVSMGISVEEAEEGLYRFAETYPEIKRGRDKLAIAFTALTQPGDVGSKIIWKDPEEYVESFLGFRRYFSLEFKIIKCLYDMAQSPSEEFKEIGKSIKLVRRDRIQTAGGATQSALYGSAFGLQGQVIRAAGNHRMQSPGGEMTKELQAAIWAVQPVGINKWYVMPLNVHDEIECPCAPEVVDAVENIVNKKVESFKEKVPLVAMEWVKGMKNWSEKK